VKYYIPEGNMKFSEEEKAMWLEDRRRSEKSAWANAMENGLAPQTFVKWAKAETEAGPCFVEVERELAAQTMAKLRKRYGRDEDQKKVPQDTADVHISSP
jgi:hypothetical protein